MTVSVLLRFLISRWNSAKALWTLRCALGPLALSSENRIRAGYRELLRWASQFGERRWAVENARGLGCHLAQWLVAQDEVVLDASTAVTAREGRSSGLQRLIRSARISETLGWELCGIAEHETNKASIRPAGAPVPGRIDPSGTSALLVAFRQVSTC